MRWVYVLAFFVVCGAQAATPSPYVGQESRSIKALSEDDIRGYIDGKGMGFAKVAELNHYPGPAHVLADAQALKLSAAQREHTEQIFQAMQSEAKALGARYVEKEKELDFLFAEGKITATQLRSALLELGELQAQLRYVHLKAHLDLKSVLTADQVQNYDRLRGYGKVSAEGDAHTHHH